jgi:hypothetical protein
MPVIFTSCSQRKRLTPDSSLRAASLPEGELSAIAKTWMERVAGAETTHRAEDVYSGRNFALSRAAANETSSPLYVVSAGLGLLRSSARIPAYSLTVAPSSADGVLGRITHPVSASDWWDALGKAGGGKSIRRVVARLRPATVLIALPASYLAMVAHDLGGLAGEDLKRLRIFTGGDQALIPDILKASVMPYGDRLDGPDSPLPGTRSDFAARALWDFSVHVLTDAPKGSAAKHAQMIQERLSAWRRPVSIARERRTDDQLLALIRDKWEAAGGRTSTLLRIVRDELGVACEQSRLSRLAAAVRATVRS